MYLMPLSLHIVQKLDQFSLQVILVINVTSEVFFNLHVSLLVSSQNISAVDNHSTVLTSVQPSQLSVPLLAGELLIMNGLQMVDDLPSHLKLGFLLTEAAREAPSGLRDEVVKAVDWAPVDHYWRRHLPLLACCRQFPALAPFYRGFT